MFAVRDLIVSAFSPVKLDGNGQPLVYRYGKIMVEFVYCRAVHPLIITLVRILLLLILASLLFTLRLQFHHSLWMIRMSTLTAIVCVLYLICIVGCYFYLDRYAQSSEREIAQSTFLYFTTTLHMTVFPVCLATLIDASLSSPVHNDELYLNERHLMLSSFFIMLVDFALSMYVWNYASVVYPVMFTLNYFVTAFIDSYRETPRPPLFEWYTDPDSIIFGMVRFVLLVTICHIILTCFSRLKYSQFTSDEYLGYQLVRAETEDDEQKG